MPWLDANKTSPFTETFIDLRCAKNVKNLLFVSWLCLLTNFLINWFLYSPVTSKISKIVRFSLSRPRIDSLERRQRSVDDSWPILPVYFLSITTSSDTWPFDLMPTTLRKLRTLNYSFCLIEVIVATKILVLFTWLR